MGLKGLISKHTSLNELYLLDFFYWMVILGIELSLAYRSNIFYIFYCIPKDVDISEVFWWLIWRFHCFSDQT